jgi:hypothetical protein
MLDIFIIKFALKIISENDIIENFDIGEFYGIIFPVWGIWFFVFLFFVVINLINAIKKFIEKNLILLEKYTKTIKFGLIPFWIINFIGYTALVIMINIPSHGFGIFIVIIAR